MTELFRSTADFALAISNIKMLIMLKMLKYPEAYNFMKKETLVQVFSSEFSKNAFFIEHLWWLLLYFPMKLPLVRKSKKLVPEQAK